MTIQRIVLVVHVDDTKLAPEALQYKLSDVCCDYHEGVLNWDSTYEEEKDPDVVADMTGTSERC